MTTDHAIDFLYHDQKLILPFFVQAIMLEHIIEMIGEVAMMLEWDEKADYGYLLCY